MGSRYAEVRYVVLAAGEEAEGERLVQLQPTLKESVVPLTVHLRDGWIDTPLVPGDNVHLLAPLIPSPEGPRAVCDYKSGAPLSLCHPPQAQQRIACAPNRAQLRHFRLFWWIPACAQGAEEECAEAHVPAVHCKSICTATRALFAHASIDTCDFGHLICWWRAEESVLGDGS